MTQHPNMFFVTVVETVDGQYSSSRCWGYYHELEDAKKAVLENHTDIHECCYDWAVIEEVPYGVLPIGTKEIVWYHWEDDAYREVEKPKFSERIVNWSIG